MNSQKKLHPQGFGRQWLATLFLLMAGIGLMAQSLKTVSVEFTLQTEEKGKTEETRGSLYFQAPFFTAVHVRYPIDQWMVMREKEMQIYYPESRRAFRITSSNVPFSMPFFQSFLAVTKEDYGLSQLGFTMDRFEKKGSQFVSYWKPPDAAKKFGEFVLFIEDDRIARLQFKDAKNQLMMESVFSNHRRFGLNEFPLEINIQRFLPNPSREKALFENPRFNIDLPEEVSGFSIPSDVEVKEVTW